MAITGISEAIIYLRAVDMTGSTLAGMSRNVASKAAQLKNTIAREQNAVQRITQKTALENERISTRALATEKKLVTQKATLARNISGIEVANQRVVARTVDLQTKSAALFRQQVTLKQKLADTTIPTDTRTALTGELKDVTGKLSAINARKRAEVAALASNQGRIVEINQRAVQIDTDVANAQAKANAEISKNTRVADEATAAINKKTLADQRQLRILEQQASLQAKTETLRSAGRATAQVGLGLTAVATMPMLVGLQATLSGAMEFDKSMRNIQAIGKQTDAQIKTLGDSFLKLSTDITKTVAAPHDLAEAFYEIQSSGRYGAEAEQILTQSTKAATAGLADTKSTAMSVTKALNAYGLGVSETTRLLDIMVRGVDIGIYRLEDFNSQMGDFINVAGMLNVPFEEVTAALTTMTKKGMQASEAATSLNRIFSTFLKPSDAARAAAEEFGITLSGETIRVKGFAAAIQEMYEKTSGNEDALAAIFRDIRGARGVFSLASDGLKMFNSDVAILKQSAGTVDSIFNDQMKAWDNQVKSFKNTLNVLAIDIGSKILPKLTELMKTDFKVFIDRMADIAPNVMSGFVDSLMGMAKAISSMSPEMLQSLGEFYAKAALYGPGLLIAGTAMQGLAAGIGLVGDAWAFLATKGVFGAVGGGGPFMLIAAGILATAAIMFDSVKSANDYSTALQKVIDKEIELAELKRLRAPVGSTEHTATQQAFRDQEAALGAQLEAARRAEIATRAVMGGARGGYGSNVQAVEKLWSQETEAIQNNITSLRLNAQAQDLVVQKTGELQAVTYGTINGINIIADAELRAGANGYKMAAGITLAAEALLLLNKYSKSLEGGIFGAASNDLVAQSYIQRGGGFAPNEKGYQDLLLAQIQATDSLTQSTIDNLIANKDLIPSLGNLSNVVDKAAGMFSSLLDEGRNFSKALGDLTGGGASGNLAPGSNGPFENIYRLQDIAMNSAKPGKDTQKWIEQLGKIDPRAGDPAFATQTVKDYQLGNFTPDVMKFIDWDALKASAQAIETSAASQEALVSKLASGAGVSTASAAQALGSAMPSGSKEAVAAAQSVEVQTANRLLDAMIGALTARATDLTNMGGAFVTSIMGGMYKEQQQFVDFFIAAMKEMLKQVSVPPPPDGDKIPPGLANGGIAPGGLALVGERGPELVDLPYGSRVYNTQQSRGLLGGSGININIRTSHDDPYAIGQRTEAGILRAARALGF